ncbi:unnamed protein product [Schistosoma turkestanicum]|nr:unnamed protein product [Schistosoma turkestanicum]
MRNVKLSTARDFRINQAAVAAHLEQSAALSVSSLSDHSEPEDNVVENLNNNNNNNNGDDDDEVVIGDNQIEDGGGDEAHTNDDDADADADDDDNVDNGENCTSQYLDDYDSDDDDDVGDKENRKVNDISTTSSSSIMRTTVDMHHENLKSDSSNNLLKSHTTVTPVWSRQVNPVSQRKSAMKRSLQSITNKNNNQSITEVKAKMPRN